jgi:hypothetical protein
MLRDVSAIALPVFFAVCPTLVSAQVDACCILKANTGNVCVNAPPVICRAHSRYVAHNPKQVCVAPGTQKTGCTTPRKGGGGESDMDITLKFMGEDYRERLMEFSEERLKSE